MSILGKIGSDWEVERYLGLQK